MIDPVGAVFQVFNRHPDTGAPLTMTSLDPNDATYLGNVVANAQALVAKAALAGAFADSNLDVSRSNITQPVLNWIEARDGFEQLARPAVAVSQQTAFSATATPCFTSTDGCDRLQDGMRRRGCFCATRAFATW